MKIRFAHIVNPVASGVSADLDVAQPVTFATLSRAREEASALAGLDVRLYTAQFPEDHPGIPDEWIRTPDLERSTAADPRFESRRKLPFLKDILERLYVCAPDADYLIYTNVDIAVQPDFYQQIHRFVEQGCDAFAINRRNIPDTYQTVEELPHMFQEVGTSHPGHDCFVFKRDLFPAFVLGDHVLGIGLCFRGLLLNSMVFAKQFAEFRDEHLTFHIGDQEEWKREAWDAFSRHNASEVRKVVDVLDQNHQIPDHPLLWRFFTEFMGQVALPEAGFQAELSLLSEIDISLERNTGILQVRVRNCSSVNWPSSWRSRIQLGNHWRTVEGEMVKVDDGRAPFHQAVPPGAMVDLDLSITPPETDGVYHLEVDLVQENVTWFSVKGSRSLLCRAECENGLMKLRILDS